jgi:predicted HicB family RNase H-like nuclease
MRFAILLLSVLLSFACKREGTESQTTFSHKDTLRYSEIRHDIAPESSNRYNVHKNG